MEVIDDKQLQGLVTPVSMGTLTLPNRFAMAPMTRFASSTGGTTLIVTEGVRIPSPAAGPDSVPLIDGAEVLRSWRAVTDAVHAEGGAIAAQLWLRARSATFLTVAGKGRRQSARRVSMLQVTESGGRCASTSSVRSPTCM